MRDAREPGEARMAPLHPFALFQSTSPRVHCSLPGGEGLLPVLKQRNVETVGHPRNQTAGAKKQTLRKRNPTSLLESWDHRRLGGGEKV